MSSDSLGNLLVRKGLLKEEQVHLGLAESRKSGGTLQESIVSQGWLSEDQILRVVSEYAGMPLVDLSTTSPEVDALKRVPGQVARQYRVVPLKMENGSLVVALSDPLDLQVLDDLRFRLGCEVKGSVAPQGAILRALKTYYPVPQGDVDQVLSELASQVPVLAGPRKSEKGELDSDNLQDLASQAPVVKLVDLILLQAVRDRASDVHFEPFEDKFMVRYRVDGALYELTPPPKGLALAVTSRIKVMSNLDVAERRLPQDGRIDATIAGRKVDLRVSTLPTTYGESVVLRVLDKQMTALSLDEMGYPGKERERLRELIKKPNGIILLTGPTGCGKTTTLYSCLKELNRDEVKIVTAEDPIEYDVPGLIQVGVKPKIGLDFAACLRSILRQDPDIIMVGETRDPETAEIAIQAALTGHLVFTTLHTNDAAGAITRLLDMGVEPFLITSALEAAVAQRLVRTICANCRVVFEPPASILNQLELTSRDIQGKQFSRGKGCEACRFTGYRGRTAIVEMLMMSDELRELTLRRAPVVEIRKAAQRAGMKTLREDGLEKIFAGMTTVEEVIRETQGF